MDAGGEEARGAGDSREPDPGGERLTLPDRRRAELRSRWPAQSAGRLIRGRETPAAVDMKEREAPPPELSRTPEERAFDEYLESALRGEAEDVGAFCARHGDSSGELRKRLEAFLSVLTVGRGEAPLPGPRPSPAAGLPFERLDDFRLLRRLGEGGMGVVFLAEQESLGRLVALKVLRPERVGSPAAAARLQREAQAIGRLRHPNIVTVIATGEDRGVRYLAMELVPGKGLDEILAEATARGERVPLRSAIQWALDIARALACAHEAGIVHRDVKPSNVRITPEGRALLVDFGLARSADSSGLTLTAEFRGTPSYASPEQVEAKSSDLDGRTDVYSLGATLYESVTGRVPFQGETKEQVFHQILTKSPPSPRRIDRAISDELETVIRTAMEKDPAHRYPTAGALAEDLRRILSFEPILIRRASPLHRLRRWTQRNPVLAAFFLLLATGLGVSLFLLARVNTEKGAKSRALERVRALALASASAEALPTDPTLALLLAREGAKALRTSETTSPLYAALIAHHERAELAGHGGTVRAAALSPDGTRVVTASDDATGRLWDLEGRTLAVLAGHKEALTDASFSPNGERIATASRDGTARVWDAEGRPCATLSGHDGGVLRARFSPAGDRIVTASSDGTARVWEEGGRLLVVLAGHWKAVTDAVFSPSGDRVATASEDGTGRIWSLEGEPIGQLLGHFAAPRSIRFSSAGDRILTASRDWTARVWDREGREVASVRHGGEMLGAEFSPTGDRILTCGTDFRATLWEPTGNALRMFQGHTDFVVSAAFSTGGEGVLTASLDQTARLFDLDGNALALFEGHGGRLTTASFSARGDLVVTGSEDRTARLWDATRSEFPVLDGPPGSVYAQVSPRGTPILADYQGMARLWSPTGEMLAEIGAPYGDPRAAAWSPRGDLFALGCDDRAVHVFDSTGREVAATPRQETFALSLCFSPEGDRIASGWKHGKVMLSDLDGRISAVLDGHRGRLWGVVFSPRGDQLLSWSVEGPARLWSLDGTGRVTLLEEGGRMSAGEFSPSGDRVLTAGDDTARLWGIDGSPRGVLRGHEGLILRASFSPEGTRILTSGYDGTARLWDSDGRPLAVLRGHKGDVCSAVFSPEGDRVLTGGRDGTARLWDLLGNELAVLRGHVGDVFVAAFFPGGDRLLTSSLDGTIRIWPARIEEVLEIADRRAFRDFKPEERWRYRDILGESVPPSR